MKKILARLTILLTLLAGTALVAQQQLLPPSSSCCANICGSDKACYRACTHDPGGPCSRRPR
ncbi:MAG TPA: hypothetical protein VF527_08025 [Pyrinomonadaceae bacterium]